MQKVLRKKLVVECRYCFLPCASSVESTRSDARNALAAPNASVQQPEEKHTMKKTLSTAVMIGAIVMPWALAPSMASADTHDVLAYGAVCDGATDDTAAFQAAVDAADSAGGGLVTMPAAVCAIGGRIKVNGMANVYLEGRGPASVLIRAPGTYGSDPVLQFSGTTSSGVRALTLDGNSSVITGGRYTGGVSVTSAQRITVSDITVRNFPGHGMAVTGSSSGPTYVEELTIDGCRFESNDYYDLSFSVYWKNVRVRDNHFEGDTRERVRFNGTGPNSGLIFTGNTVVQTATNPAVIFSWGHIFDSVIADNVIFGSMSAYQLGRTEISRNRIVHDDGGGISIFGSVGPIIVANNTIESSSWGIAIPAKSGTNTDVEVSMIGNRIRSDYGGISMVKGARLSIVGNTISTINGEGTSHGVYLWALAEVNNVLIANNQIEDFVHGVNLGPYSTGTFDVDTVLITENVIRSTVTGARGVVVNAGPNGKGSVVSNYEARDNLFVAVPAE